MCPEAGRTSTLESRLDRESATATKPHSSPTRIGRKVIDRWFNHIYFFNSHVVEIIDNNSIAITSDESSSVFEHNNSDDIMTRRSEFGLTDTMLTISGLVLKRYIHHVATLAPDYHLQSDIDERFATDVFASTCFSLVLSVLSDTRWSSLAVRI